MNINLDLLKKLEKVIDPANPEKGLIPIKILGYGEISLVFEIIGANDNLAYKKIPIFDTEKQVRRHIWAYKAYNSILLKRIGLLIPESGSAWFKDHKGKIQFYCVQEKLDINSVGNKVIHQISDHEVEVLIKLVLNEFKKVWSFNKRNPIIDVGLDGQISNFAVINFNPSNPHIDENTKLLYLDTSTPMIRINGKEAMEAVLFLKSAPAFLRGILKAAFLKDTVERYYDLRRVIIDLIANFYKEERAELIPKLIRLANSFLKGELDEFQLAPLTNSEIQKYYKSDAQMWRVFQAVRKLDRFFQVKLFRKHYDFYLPEKISR